MDGLKITVFGPGVGESIVLEVSDLVCMVDCCRPAAEYIVDMAGAKRRFGFFLLTHPHFDHYQCAERVLDLPFEKLCMFAGMHAAELSRILRDRAKERPRNRNLRASARSFGRLNERWRATPVDRRRQVSLDTLVWEHSGADWDLRVMALAPTLEGIEAFNRGLGSLPYSEVDSECAQKCNAASVVLEVTFNGKRVLLTSDVGLSLWPSTRIEPVDVLKLPHHGSPRDNTIELLDSLLETKGEPVVVVTPYASSYLPDASLLQSIREKVIARRVGGHLIVTGSAKDTRAARDWAHAAAVTSATGLTADNPATIRIGKDGRIEVGQR